MRRKLTLCGVALTSCLLGACGTPIAAIDGGCMSFKPIRWSKNDTTQTKREVVAHNRVYDTLCKGG